MVIWETKEVWHLTLTGKPKGSKGLTEEIRFGVKLREGVDVFLAKETHM